MNVFWKLKEPYIPEEVKKLNEWAIYSAICVIEEENAPLLGMELSPESKQGYLLLKSIHPTFYS